MVVENQWVARVCLSGAVAFFGFVAACFDKLSMRVSWETLNYTNLQKQSLMGPIA